MPINNDRTKTDSPPSLWHSLFNSETFAGEKFRPLANALVFIFAIAYAVMFPGLMQYVAFLGPGLGDNWSYDPFLQFLHNTWDFAGGKWTHPLVLGIAVLVITNLVFTAAMIILGYTLYPRLVGKPFPVSVLFTYFSLSAICTTGIGLMHVLLGLLAMALGYDFFHGLSAVDTLLNQLRGWAQQVPTLVEMPAW